MRLQIRIQFCVGGLSLSGAVVGDELHLLRQAAADDQIVLIKTQRERLAVKHFLAHTCLDQLLQFFIGGWPLTGSGEALEQGAELSLRDHDLARLTAGFVLHQAERDEKRGSQQEEMQQGLAKNSLHEWTANKRGSGAQNLFLPPLPPTCEVTYGLYQMGEV